MLPSPLYKESEAQKVREFAWNYTASVYQLDFEFNQINSKSHSYSLMLCLDIWCEKLFCVLEAPIANSEKYISSSPWLAEK